MAGVYGILAAAVVLVGLAIAGYFIMRSMQNRGERGFGDTGPDISMGAGDNGHP